MMHESNVSCWCGSKHDDSISCWCGRNTSHSMQCAAHTPAVAVGVMQWTAPHCRVHNTNPAAKCQQKLFCSATDTVGLSVPQEQGTCWTAKEVSAIKRAPREAGRSGHCAQPSVYQLARVATAVDPASAASSCRQVAGSPSPSPPPPPSTVRRLNITMGSQQTADPVAQPQSSSLECAARPVEEAEWAPSYHDQLSPDYPTPPPAPPKDQYIAPSDTESEAETSDSERPTPGGGGGVAADHTPLAAWEGGAATSTPARETAPERHPRLQSAPRLYQAHLRKRVYSHWAPLISGHAISECTRYLVLRYPYIYRYRSTPYIGYTPISFLRYRGSSNIVGLRN